jgi:PAS domain S-box-containing protein
VIIMNSAVPPRAIADTLRGLDELRYALDQAAIVAATDHRGIITYVNDKFCELSEYSRAELLGQDHRIVNSGYHPKPFIRDLWTTIANGQVWRGELCNRAKNGSVYWVDTTIVPFVNGAGKPRQYLSIRYDITARKRAEAELREREALVQLGQVAAVVAHEVRNPLAGLKATLQVMAPRVPEPGDREVMGAMIKRIDDLNGKVSDLLLYARPHPPRLRTVEVRSLLAEVATSARAAVNPEGPPVAIIGDDCWARADAEMLRAAFLNLVVNACQACPTDLVDVLVVTESDRCRVIVRDRGRGIPPDIRDRVFEPFVTTRPSCTGLGLAIVNRLISLQDGSVSLFDRPGGGTLAEVVLPRAAA